MDTENLISSKVLIVEIKRKIKGLEPLWFKPFLIITI